MVYIRFEIKQQPRDKGKEFHIEMKTNVSESERIKIICQDFFVYFLLRFSFKNIFSILNLGTSHVC